MIVNIHGKGKIPGLGILAPTYNKDLSEREIRRLLNFSNIKVYQASTGLFISKKNIDNIFKAENESINNVKVEKVDVIKNIDTKTTPLPEIKIEEDVVTGEIVAEPVEEVEMVEVVGDELVSTSDDDVETEDVIEAEIVTDTIDSEDDVKEEEIVETNKNNNQNGYNKKKNKNKKRYNKE